MDKKMKANPNINKEVAGSFFHPSDYKSNNEISQGLATTHEQVSDTYAEGVIDSENN